MRTTTMDYMKDNNTCIIKYISFIFEGRDTIKNLVDYKGNWIEWSNVTDLVVIKVCTT